MSEDKGLETLQVWQKALALAIRVQKEILPILPDEERWGLCNQIRRSAQSVPANIAEGYGRYYYQDAVRFCYIARGSLEELFSHITLSSKLGYISLSTCENLNEDIRDLRRMLNGYIIFLKKSKRGETEPGMNLQVNEEISYYESDSVNHVQNE